MAVVKVYDQDKTEQGELTLTPEVFEVAVRPEILQLVVRAQLAAKRAGTHSTKTRAMVSGGGVKPWRQKGTGRARQGSIRSPQWTHGGIALGPKPRDYSYRLNKKVKRLAIVSALSAKAQAGEMVVIDKIEAAEYKTKTVAAMLKAVDAAKKALIVTPAVDEKLVKSAANLAGVSTTVVGQINTYAVLNGGKLVISADAAKKLEEVFA